MAVARVIEDDILRIGKLLIVVEIELTARGRDCRRMHIEPETPAGDVDIVDAIVSHVAGAKVVPPVPAVMDAVGLKRHHRRGAHPQVIVQTRRRRPGRAVADIFAALAVPDFADQDFADFAIAY